MSLNSNLTNLLGLGFIKLLNGGVIRCANWGNTNANTLRITLSNLNLLLNDAVKFLVITRYGFYFYNVTIGGSGTLGCSTLGYMSSTTGVYGITKISDSVVDITLGSWTGVTVFSFCPSNGAFNWSATRINK